MGGKFLDSNSVFSDRSYSLELEEQSKTQSKNSKLVASILIGLLVLNAAFFVVIFVVTVGLPDGEVSGYVGIV
jgi:hypothetical protein